MQSLEENFAAYEVAFNWLAYIGFGFLGLILLEMLLDYAFKARQSWKETFANWSIYLIGVGLEYTGLGLVFLIGLSLVSPFALTSMPESVWYWPLALIFADFLYYWMHRTEHRVRLLWAVHVTHHSSPEFNFSTALRLSWFEALFEWVFLVPMIVFGFGIAETLVAFFSVVTYQNWIHTNKIGRLPFLDSWLNTPSNHRVHHGSNPRYIDKNYGGILVIWDRLFGTYQREDEKVVYGITDPLNNANPFVINGHEFIDLFKDLRKAKTVLKKIRTLMGPPGMDTRP
ncbi:sterol desaturase family protein [Sneathiella sp.]|jgi:sterol desaturase/sphingolipid hydroxylase (fatty acid hydroxylase superfamily)|uniref:sterol desaturase family protein n=1 Tax=Sneathiella sp. TaxID=1964365 RepID=UPI0039E4872B